MRASLHSVYRIAAVRSAGLPILPILPTDTAAKRMRHADQRLVDRHVAVRVKAAHHVADDLGALAVLDVGRQVLLPHREEDAALDWLEAIAHVGKRTRGDDRQRVVQVPRLRGFMERDDIAAGGRPGSGRARPGSGWPASRRRRDRYLRSL